MRSPSRTSRSSGLDVPPRGRLTPTSGVDAVAHYDGIGYGSLLRQRLKWVRDALPYGRIARVLDVGYGSGVFFPELARHAKSLFGVDIHPNGARTRTELSACGVDVTLARGTGVALPFQDYSFDAVVIVSALEFIEEPGLALAEAYRVTRHGGAVLAITPRPHRWADLAYAMLVGFDPEANFQGGRARVRRALEGSTLPIRRLPRPSRLPRSLALYDLLVIERPALASAPPVQPARAVAIPAMRKQGHGRPGVGSTSG